MKNNLNGLQRPRMGFFDLILLPVGLLLFPFFWLALVWLEKLAEKKIGEKESYAEKRRVDL